MTKPGAVAAIAAIALGVASFVGWGSTSSSRVTSSATATSRELDGAAVFRAKGCSTCHDGPDTQSLIDGFPNLSDVASFASSRKPGYTAEEYLAESIKDPGVFFSPAFHGGVGPTTEMPTLDVSDAEVDALVAYLLDSSGRHD
jgi:mono/diheme cytochrome c family protein